LPKNVRISGFRKIPNPYPLQTSAYPDATVNLTNPIVSRGSAIMWESNLRRNFGAGEWNVFRLPNRVSWGILYRWQYRTWDNASVVPVSKMEIALIAKAASKEEERRNMVRSYG
jgi:hypothetical protein